MSSRKRRKQKQREERHQASVQCHQAEKTQQPKQKPGPHILGPADVELQPGVPSADFMSAKAFRIETQRDQPIKDRLGAEPIPEAKEKVKTKRGSTPAQLAARRSNLEKAQAAKAELTAERAAKPRAKVRTKRRRRYQAAPHIEHGKYFGSAGGLATIVCLLYWDKDTQQIDISSTDVSRIIGAVHRRGIPKSNATAYNGKKMALELLVAERYMTPDAYATYQHLTFDLVLSPAEVASVADLAVQITLASGSYSIGAPEALVRVSDIVEGNCSLEITKVLDWDTADAAPTSDTEVEAPASDTEVEAPVSAVEVKAPTSDTEVEAPVSAVEVATDETATQQFSARVAKLRATALEVAQAYAGIADEITAKLSLLIDAAAELEDPLARLKNAAQVHLQTELDAAVIASQVPEQPDTETSEILTPAQETYLRRRSSRLLTRVMTGKVSVAEAMSLAKDMSDQRAK